MPDDTQIQDFRNVRVDQVGSLAPPPKLRAAFRRFKNAEISKEDLTPFQDDAIREIIQGQEQSAFRSSRTESFAVRTFKKASGQPSRASMLRTKTRQWRV
jgi:methionine synthase II (cobalamin-independent)